MPKKNLTSYVNASENNRDEIEIKFWISRYGQALRNCKKSFFSLCISAFTITTKFGIQIMRELNVRHNSRKCFSKVVWLWKKHSGKNRNGFKCWSGHVDSL